MKNIILKLSYTFVAILAITAPALAQGPGAPPLTPIDGGLSLLLAAGGAYGVKKIVDAKKKHRR